MPHNNIASIYVKSQSHTSKIILNPIAHVLKMCIVPDMDKNALMKQVEQRAFDCRIGLPALCKKAGVSRYLNDGTVPRLPTIGKLETALAQL